MISALPSLIGILCSPIAIAYNFLNLVVNSPVLSSDISNFDFNLLLRCSFHQETLALVQQHTNPFLPGDAAAREGLSIQPVIPQAG